MVVLGTTIHEFACNVSLAPRNSWMVGPGPTMTEKAPYCLLCKQAVVQVAQFGFASVMRRTFHARRHLFSVRSRRIAVLIVSCVSTYTSRVRPYFFVKPGTAPVLCCQARSAMA